MCPENPSAFGFFPFSSPQRPSRAPCLLLFSAVTCLLCNIYSVDMSTPVSQCSILHLKLPSFPTSPVCWLSSHERFWPIPDLQNPAALSSSASLLPCALLQAALPLPSLPSIISYVNQLAWESCGGRPSFQPSSWKPQTHKPERGPENPGWQQQQW